MEKGVNPLKKHLGNSRFFNLKTRVTQGLSKTYSWDKCNRLKPTHKSQLKLPMR